MVQYETRAGKGTYRMDKEVQQVGNQRVEQVVSKGGWEQVRL